MSVSISVNNLRKEFIFKEKNKNWFKHLINPDTKKIMAVKDVSFEVQKGERLAFIGPNGAGKSTIIKMLTGILQPTNGKISIEGFNPGSERKKLAKVIGTVFGQRSQLFPNLTMKDSFEFFGTMFDLSNHEINLRMNKLIEQFELESFANQPIRKLSLGQRMKTEIAVALIHRPKIILLDEPTIGLDIVSKKNLRDILLELNKNENTTIFLTSHDVGDIESLCERAIIVNRGEIVLDRPTKNFSEQFSNEKIIELILKHECLNYPNLPIGLTYKNKEFQKISITVDTQLIPMSVALTELIRFFEVEDLNIHSVDMETIIRQIYERNSNRN